MTFYPPPLGLPPAIADAAIGWTSEQCPPLANESGDAGAVGAPFARVASFLEGVAVSGLPAPNP